MIYTIGAAKTGPDAADNLMWYFCNSGADRHIRLWRMIAEAPSAKKAYDLELAEAKKFVETLPVGKHEINSTRLTEENTLPTEKNWYYAIGGYSRYGKGDATVDVCNGKKRYNLNFDYRIRDRYNWDLGKHVKLEGITITDWFMGEFHRRGLAKEYDVFGEKQATCIWREP